MESLHPQKTNWNLLWWRIILAITLLLNIPGLYQFAWPFYKTEDLFISRKLMFIVGLGILAIIAELALLIISWTKFQATVRRGLNAITYKLSQLGVINAIAYALCLIGCGLLVFGPFVGEHLQGIFIPLSLFWLVVLIGCVLLKSLGLRKTSAISTNGEHLGWAGYLGISLILTACGYRVASFIPDISTYPFTLYWSETSRYYYASLFLSEHIYGIATPPTVLHPSRYLMQAAPFLLSNSPLWLHRAWQVFLWLATSFTTAALLARRLSISSRLQRWLFALWTFIFILIGPIYYHLQVPVIIMVWGFNTGSRYKPKVRFLKSLVAILLASAWAGISRINWFPMPGLIAATIYFLEEPLAERSSTDHRWSLRTLTPYVLKPLGWTILGTAVAFASQALYILWSGNTAKEFTSSFSSGLLWNRLLPNPTYPLGILLAIVLVSLPIFVLIYEQLNKQRNRMPVGQGDHPIRLLGVGAILSVLFIGGLVVSVKIGGGSNLHNLDGYMTILVIAAAYIFFEKAVPDHPATSTNATQSCEEPANHPIEQPGALSTRQVQPLGLILTLIVPILFSVTARGPSTAPPTEKQITKGLNIITRRVEQTSQAGGEVLFISNRHLLTFHYVKDVPLIPEYERVFLMEMAMAGSADYLSKFHNDLKSHRFALIINEPLYLQEKGEDDVFGEENNAWVDQVSQYIQCYYQEDTLARGIHVQLFIPDPNASNCP